MPSLRRQPAHRSPPLAGRQANYPESRRPPFLRQRSICPCVDPKYVDRHFVFHNHSRRLNYRNNLAGYRSVNRNFANRNSVNRNSVNRNFANRNSANRNFANRSCGSGFSPEQKSLWITLPTSLPSILMRRFFSSRASAARYGNECATINRRTRIFTETEFLKASEPKFFLNLTAVKEKLVRRCTIWSPRSRKWSEAGLGVGL